MTETPLSNSEVDRLGDSLLREGVSSGTLELLDRYRRSFAAPYEEVMLLLRTKLNLAPTGRPAKSTTSIIDKLHRESIRLSQMQDIAGCRVIVKNSEILQSTVTALTGTFSNSQLIDRRIAPSHGYRAVHVVAMLERKPIEIQVRTELQHLWAELSEKFADVFSPALKYGGGPLEKRALLLSKSAEIAALEEEEIGYRGDELARREPHLDEREDILRSSLQNEIRSVNTGNDAVSD